MASGVLGQGALDLAAVIRLASLPGADPSTWTRALLLARALPRGLATLVAAALLDNPGLALLPFENPDLFARLSGEARTVIARAACGLGPLRDVVDDSPATWLWLARAWEESRTHHDASARAPSPVRLPP